MLFDPSFDYAARTAEVYQALDRLNAFLQPNEKKLGYEKAVKLPEYRYLLDEYYQIAEAAYPPDFWKNLWGDNESNTDKLENIIAFLEANPPVFRSYVIKRSLLRAVKKAALSEAQEERLRGVILQAVDTAYRREFAELKRLAIHVDHPEFRAALRERLHSPDRHIARRAGWILEALRDK